MPPPTTRSDRYGTRSRPRTASSRTSVAVPQPASRFLIKREKVPLSGTFHIRARRLLGREDLVQLLAGVVHDGEAAVDLLGRADGCDLLERLVQLRERIA